jgi:hypothetical protein
LSEPASLPVDDLLPGDELAPTLDEQDQQVHRLASQLDRLTRSAQLVIALTGALIAAASTHVLGRSNDNAVLPGPTGAWTVQVTLRDCSTNAPLGPSFNSLVTLHGDGTISESAGSLALAPGQRSAGHGQWTRVGRHTYRQRLVALVLFDTPANLPGTPTFDSSLPIGPGFLPDGVPWSTP